MSMVKFVRPWNRPRATVEEVWEQQERTAREMWPAMGVEPDVIEAELARWKRDRTGPRLAGSSPRTGEQ